MNDYKTIAESRNFIVLDKYTKDGQVNESYQSEGDLEREERSLSKVPLLGDLPRRAAGAGDGEHQVQDHLPRAGPRSRRHD